MISIKILFICFLFHVVFGDYTSILNEEFVQIVTNKKNTFNNDKAYKEVINVLTKYLNSARWPEPKTMSFDMLADDYVNLLLNITNTIEDYRQKLNSPKEHLEQIKQLLLSSKTVTSLDIMEILFNQFYQIELNPSKCCNETVNNVTELIKSNFKTYSDNVQNCALDDDSNTEESESVSIKPNRIAIEALRKRYSINRSRKSNRSVLYTDPYAMHSNSKPRNIEIYSWRPIRGVRHAWSPLPKKFKKYESLIEEWNLARSNNIFQQCKHAEVKIFLKFVKKIWQTVVRSIRFSCDMWFLSMDYCHHS